MRSLRIFAIFAAFVCFAVQVNSANAEKVVRVVGYTFPPFVSKDGTGGLTTNFLTFLNNQQSTYRFEFSKVHPNRRYWAIEKQVADIVVFEMPEWGWQKHALLFDETRALLHGGEVYISRAEEGRGQTFFDDLKSKLIAGVLGYHYGFADFNSDSKWLKKNFSIILNNDPGVVIKLVLKGRADVGVVTQSYLSRYLAKHPEAVKELLISKKKDQKYLLRALIGKHAPITTSEFESLLDRLKSSGNLKRFFDSNGVGAHFAF